MPTARIYQRPKNAMQSGRARTAVCGVCGAKPRFVVALGLATMATLLRINLAGVYGR